MLNQISIKPSEYAVEFVKKYQTGICGATFIEGLPPSANQAWLPSYRGRGMKVRSKEYDAFIKKCRFELRGLFLMPTETPMALFIGLHSPRFITKKGLVSKTMDIDNRIKTLIDVLHGSGRKDQGALIKVDDSLYWHIDAHKIPSIGMEMTEVIVANIPQLSCKLL